jgi:hypothetical protein
MPSLAEKAASLPLKEKLTMNRKIVLLVGAAFAGLPNLGYSQCPTSTFVWLNSYDVVAGPTAGSLLKGLEAPPGFEIQEVVVCSTPLPGNIPPVIGASINHWDNSAVPLPGTSGLPCSTYEIPSSPPLLNPNNFTAGPATLAIQLPLDPTNTFPVVQVTGIGLVLAYNTALWGVPDHGHAYRTGRGRGHNNTLAVTEGVDDCVPPASVGGGDDGGNTNGGGNGNGNGGGGNGNGNGGGGNGKGKGNGGGNGKGKNKGDQ